MSGRVHTGEAERLDMLHGDGRDMPAVPLSARKAWLAPTSTSGTRRAPLFRIITNGDHEGIVAKRLDSQYRAWRQSHWLKIKKARDSRPAALDFGR